MMIHRETIILRAGTMRPEEVVPAILDGLESIGADFISHLYELPDYANAEAVSAWWDDAAESADAHGWTLETDPNDPTVVMLTPKPTLSDTARRLMRRALGDERDALEAVADAALFAPSGTDPEEVIHEAANAHAEAVSAYTRDHIDMLADYPDAIAEAFDVSTDPNDHFYVRLHHACMVAAYNYCIEVGHYVIDTHEEEAQ